MAVTRKTPEEMVQNIKTTLLNRPDEDDLFEYPEEYFVALNKAQERIRRKIIDAAPFVLIEATTVTSSDGGYSYDLTDIPMGQIEVWAPPGPPTGERLMPALPESPYFGFWIDGSTIKFTSPQSYSPLYIRWVPENTPTIGKGDSHVLPPYCENMLEYEAAFIMANKQGFPGNPAKFSQLADFEWRGRDSDPSDMGILGTIRRQAANQGFETASGGQMLPWYRRIV